MTSLAIYTICLFALIVTIFWRRIVKTDRSAEHIIAGTLPSPKLPKIPGFIGFIMQFSITAIILLICIHYTTQNPKVRVLVDRSGLGWMMRGSEVSDPQAIALRAYESSAELKMRQCLGKTRQEQDKELQRLLKKAETMPLSDSEQTCMETVMRPIASPHNKQDKKANGIMSIFSQKPDPVWTQVKTFGYTPNKPDWTPFVFVAPEDGDYRPICKNGYYQRNIPTYNTGYGKQIPCKGSWLPSISTIPGYSQHQIAEQLVSVNGQDLTGGHKSIHLKKGEEALIAVMPNIGKIRRKSPSRESVFAGNTGTVHFSIEQLIAL